MNAKPKKNGCTAMQPPRREPLLQGIGYLYIIINRQKRRKIAISSICQKAEKEIFYYV